MINDDCSKTLVNILAIKNNLELNAFSEISDQIAWMEESKLPIFYELVSAQQIKFHFGCYPDRAEEYLGIAQHLSNKTNIGSFLNGRFNSILYDTATKTATVEGGIQFLATILVFHFFFILAGTIFLFKSDSILPAIFTLIMYAILNVFVSKKWQFWKRIKPEKYKLLQTFGYSDMRLIFKTYLEFQETVHFCDKNSAKYDLLGLNKVYFNLEESFGRIQSLERVNTKIVIVPVDFPKYVSLWPFSPKKKSLFNNFPQNAISNFVHKFEVNLTEADFSFQVDVFLNTNLILKRLLSAFTFYMLTQIKIFPNAKSFGIEIVYFISIFLILFSIDLIILFLHFRNQKKKHNIKFRYRFLQKSFMQKSRES